MKKTLIGLAVVAAFIPCAAFAAAGPTVTITSTDTSPTRQEVVPITVTFSSPVTGFTASSVQTSGAAKIDASSFSGSRAQYTFSIDFNGDGEADVAVPANTATDNNGNGNQAGQFSITRDSQRPHISLSPDPLPFPVSGPFTVVFNSIVAVVDFTPDKVSVTNATVSDLTQTGQKDGRNFTFVVTPDGPGAIDVSIPEGALHSASGEPNVASNPLATRMGPLTLSGTVWQDANGSGSQNKNDLGLSGWSVTASPVDAQGNPDSSRNTTTVITDSTGAYSFTFAQSQFGRWAIAPIMQDNWILSSGATTTVDAEVDSNFTNTVDFGVTQYVNADGALLIPIGGDANSARAYLTPADGPTTIQVGEVLGTSTVVLPPSTKITKEGGGKISISDILDPAPPSDQGNFIKSGSLKWGLIGSSLSFSKPIAFSLFVGNLSGESLSVFQNTGSIWQNIATCSPVNEICTFQSATAPLNPFSPIVNEDPPAATAVSITSNNKTDPSVASVGQKVTLTFTADRALKSETVSIEGHVVKVVSTGGNSYSASYKLASIDPAGAVPFSITLTDTTGKTSQTITSTTDGSSVSLDAAGPTASLSATASGKKNQYALSINFSEGVSGLRATDLTATGATLKALTTISPSQYSITVMPTGGPVTISLAADAVKDAAGNTNAAANYQFNP